jgi:hypothetical protein
VNLADLANFVCTSTGYLDPDDQAAVRTFLLARDRMIYDSALWKSALLMTTLALDPVNDLDHAEGIVVLPEEFQRPVGVRTTDNAVRVNAVENYFRFDADKFAETGSPFEFAEIQPLFVVWRGISAIAVSCDPTESEVTIKIVWRDGNKVRTDEVTLNPAGVGNTAYITPANAQPIVVSGAGFGDVNGSYSFEKATGYFKQTNGTGCYLRVEGNFWVLRTPDLTSVLYWAEIGSRVWLNTDTPGDPDAAVSADPPGPTVTFPAAGRGEILAVYKTATQKAIQLGYSPSEGALSSIVLGTIDAEATNSPSFPRLRLFGIPSVAVNLRVLGKAKYLPLSDDRQEQTLRNSENCLIAFARGDLLRRGGENGAAQLAYQEAGVLLQQLKDIEAVQAANNQRIIPDQGYGPEWGIGPYIRPYF